MIKNMNNTLFEGIVSQGINLSNIHLNINFVIFGFHLILEINLDSLKKIEFALFSFYDIDHGEVGKTI